ncbi:MAG: TonB-dependent receptor, partial [Candidatus Marinimicrobia bacterium]|nr:TonB-dependent receptor [Candidatus Neomarinimicrobiota bacterium]
KKNKIAWKSGALFGDNISVRTRYTNQLSDGYRDFHDSEQNSFYLGIEQRGSKITNQFRVLLGKEITNQTWDGVYQNYIDDRDLRRVGVEAYTDNFYQKIISLNSKYRLNSHSFLSNTAYVVQGEGFYEVFKIDQDFYSYNLDEGDISKYQNESDFLRRKWIVNQYSGLIPQYSYQTETLRLDMGAEIRSYAGDHFGEISQFSDTLLADKYADNWVRYYRYKGKKHSTSAFARLSYTVTNDLSLMFDLQLQQQDWTLDQEPIGHATGYELATVWRFINPRLGAMYNFTSDVSIYVNYSQADKEPADNQIIEADDVWSEPVYAAAESIDDYELGFYYKSKFAQINLNMYRIHFFNEQLKTIDVNQEGEYDSFSADETIHQGIEFEVNFQTFNKVYFDINA